MGVVDPIVHKEFWGGGPSFFEWMMVSTGCTLVALGPITVTAGLAGGGLLVWWARYAVRQLDESSSERRNVS